MKENEILDFNPSELEVFSNEENTCNDYTIDDEIIYQSNYLKNIYEEVRKDHPTWSDEQCIEYYKAYIDMPLCCDNCLYMWLDDSEFINGDGDQDCTLRIGMNTGCQSGDVVIYKDTAKGSRWYYTYDDKNKQLVWGSGTRGIMKEDETLNDNKIWNDPKYGGNIYLQTRGNWEINELIGNFETILRQLKYIRKYGKHN